MDNDDLKKTVVLNLTSHLIGEPNNGEWQLLPLEHQPGSGYPLTGHLRYGELRAIIPTTTTEAKRDYSGQQQVEITRTTLMGLFRKDDTTIHEEIRAECNQAKVQRDAATKAQYEAEKQIKVLKEQVADGIKKANEALFTCDHKAQEALDAQTKVRRYEQDIAKLRSALGDLRMKEILGS